MDYIPNSEAEYLYSLKLYTEELVDVAGLKEELKFSEAEFLVCEWYRQFTNNLCYKSIDFNFDASSYKIL